MGGTNHLAQKLLSKPIRFFYDVSGWDKYIPIMPELYKEIMTMTKEWLVDDDVEEFTWMVRNTIEFVCVLYDGDIVHKKYGNASGSGTTTRDNILMHVIIAAAFLSEAYYAKIGKLPTFQLLSEQIVKLFGDDSVFAVDYEFDHVLHDKDSPDGFLNTFYKRMGLKLKFLFGGENYDVEKMSFLGFTFKKVNGIYLPLYEPQRLATSFLHTNDKSDTLEAYVSKLFVLTLMSYATPEFDLFFKGYINVVNTLTGDLSPELRSFSQLRLTPEILWGFYTGSESNYFTQSPFFDWVMEVVGRNNCFCPYVISNKHE
nr:RNA-dependent RNA polymerase [Flumine Astrovirus 22]